jgi:hypothetical protein
MEYVVISEDDQVVGCKRKCKSDVWLDFDEVTIGGRQKAQCRWCRKYPVADSKSGTTYLRGHLNICASHQVRKDPQQATLKLGKNEHGSVVVEKYAFDQQVARKELSLMICVHEYLLSTTKEMILSLIYLTSSCQRNLNNAPLICVLSWIYIWRSQHCQ